MPSFDVSLSTRYGVAGKIAQLSGSGVLPIGQGGTNANDIVTARSNLGLGSIATQAASAVAITGGSATGLSSVSATAITENGVALTSKYAQLGANNIFSSSSYQTMTSSGLNALKLESTDAGATSGPVLLMDRMGGSPAAGDYIGTIQFRGQDSALNITTYASIISRALDTTDASEDARLYFQLMIGGAATNVLGVGPGVAVGSATDMGANTLNAGTLYENGTALTAKYGQLAVTNTWTAYSSFTQTNTSAPNLGVTTTEDSANPGPYFDLHRVSASPAASDALCQIRMYGRDSAGNSTQYVQFAAVLVDPTDTQEDGRLNINTMTAGAMTLCAYFQAGMVVGAPTGADKGAGTLNAVTLYENGTLVVDKYGAKAAANQWNAQNTFARTVGGDVNITLTTAADDNFIGPILEFDRISASPAASDNLGHMKFFGRDAVGTKVEFGRIGVALIDPTDGAETGRLNFTMTAAGSFAVMAYIQSGLTVGAPTGGDKGVGSINAVNVYDDNVLLTCLPLQKEFIDAGQINLAKWDALSPTGHHRLAHQFAELVTEGIDPRDPQRYVNAMLAGQALPGMPSMTEWSHGGLSTGEMITRLWLAVEMLAVAWMSDREKYTRESQS